MVARACIVEMHIARILIDGGLVKIANGVKRRIVSDSDQSEH